MKIKLEVGMTNQEIWKQGYRSMFEERHTPVEDDVMQKCLREWYSSDTMNFQDMYQAGRQAAETELNIPYRGYSIQEVVHYRLVRFIGSNEDDNIILILPVNIDNSTLPYVIVDHTGVVKYRSLAEVSSVVGGQAPHLRLMRMVKDWEKKGPCAEGRNE